MFCVRRVATARLLPARFLANADPSRYTEADDGVRACEQSVNNLLPNTR